MSQDDDMDAERKHYSYNVTLRIRHPDIDPQEITTSLGIQPKWTWRAGEARRTPVGTPLSGVYRHNYWFSTLRKAEYLEQSLTDALGELLDQFVPFKDFFRSIRSTGGHIEFFIGWSLYHNSGEVFEPELLARLADFQIALSLDVYGPSSET